MLTFADTPPLPTSYLPGGASGSASGDGSRADTVQSVIDYVTGDGYDFEPWQIATFITALKTKPFIILAGISGTGKTKLPQLVARATGAKSKVVPVRPDWTDSSDLLGFTDLAGNFQPGHLLRICREATENSDTQFFFILDEMNVARVEYYFAEVLSLLENRFRVGDEIRTEPLVPNAPVTADGWSNVYLPSNVSIIGTVNMDETTHGFSRKVLDRAFVLELSDVDLSRAPPRAEQPDCKPWPASEWQPNALRLAESADAGADVVTEAIQALTRANVSLAIAQLQVGYRVRDEVALFCLNARAYADQFVESDETIVSPLDLCMSMKVLPRIQGGGGLIRSVLDDLSEWANGSESVDQASEAPSDFPRTLDRIGIMQQRLDATGFTSYWI